MKKFLCVVMAVVAVSAFAAVWMGSGKIINVPTTAQVVDSLEANMVSVYNVSGTTTGVVWALVNSDAATLSNRVVLGTAVPIAVGSSFLFDTREKSVILNVALQAASGSNVVYVGAY